MTELTKSKGEYSSRAGDERRDARAERAVARLARAERRARRAAKAAHAKAKVDAAYDCRRVFEGNADPLLVYDRDDRPASLRGLWGGASGFLVCGGPSANQIDGLADRLRERGVVSLAVNNSAAHWPVRAMTFSDPPEKFHHGVFFDPALMKLVPRSKLKRGQVRIKFPDGSFKFSGLNVRDCPNVWGYERICEWRTEEFLTREGATWGNNDQGVRATGGQKILFTMFLGLRLLHYLGCRRAFLIGADFRMTPDRGYAFSQGRTAGAAMSNNNSYRVAGEFFRELRPVLDAAGFEVYNANPTSALEAFPYKSFEECHLLARGYVPLEPFDLQSFYEYKGEGRGDTAQ